MGNFLDKLLQFYSMSYEEYDSLRSDVTKKTIPDFSYFKDIEKIKDYFFEVKKLNKKVYIYGDYDCDGIMSTSIMSLLFDHFRINHDYYIPLRDKDGYGLTKDNIDKIKKKGYDIILCVDNGITLKDEVDYANSIGVDVVIFDHHPLDVDNIPNAKFILHPTYSNFGPINLSAGAVCFYFSWCMLGFIDDYLLVLGMISLISDMMELRSYNHDLVKLGLKILNVSRYKNLVLLAENAINFNETTISLKIAPKVNAIGRIVLTKENKKIVQYFKNINTFTTAEECEWINYINSLRKQLVNEFVFNKDDYSDKASICLFKSDIEEGLCGLIANNVLSAANKPSVVLCEDSNDPSILKGSIRSKNGFDINEFFVECGELLVRHGGHAQAAGLAIRKNYLTKFEEKLENFALIHPFNSNVSDFVEIDENEINMENLNILNSFAPFGIGLNLPSFKISNFPVSKFNFMKGGKHLNYMNWSTGGKIVYFNFDQSILGLETITLYGKMALNVYNNRKSVQIIVEKIEKI